MPVGHQYASRGRNAGSRCYPNAADDTPSRRRLRSSGGDSISGGGGGESVSASDGPTSGGGPSAPGADGEEVSDEFLVRELQSTLQRNRHRADNQGTGVAQSPTDLICLEVNSLKYAHGVDIEDLRFLLTKTLLEMAGMEAGASKEAKDYALAFKRLVAQFGPVLLNYLDGDESAQFCLQVSLTLSIRTPVIELGNITPFSEAQAFARYLSHRQAWRRLLS